MTTMPWQRWIKQGATGRMKDDIPELGLKKNDKVQIMSVDGEDVICKTTARDLVQVTVWDLKR